MRVEMNVDMDDFSQSCSVLLSRVSRGTRIAAQEGGAAILRAAQARCPIYTGTLANSGILTVTGSSANDYREGFTAEIAFGGGERVNPITGQHPSEYAAAVHEGFAVNPITGEMSRYKSGEAKFLEKAVRDFERTGLHKIAYKHWNEAFYGRGGALKYYEATQSAIAEDYRVDRAGRAPIGAEKIERYTMHAGRMSMRREMSTAIIASDFLSDSKLGKQQREMTRIFMGVEADTPGVTDTNLLKHYLRHQSIIKEAYYAALDADTYGVYAGSEAVQELARAFVEGGVLKITGRLRYAGYTLKDARKLTDPVKKASANELERMMNSARNANGREVY